VDSHLNVAEVPIEEEICNMVMNPQTNEQVDTENEEENSKALPSSKKII
jgi:hypothetical protein